MKTFVVKILIIVTVLTQSSDLLALNREEVAAVTLSSSLRSNMNAQELTDLKNIITAWSEQGFHPHDDFEVFLCIDASAGGLTVAGKAAVCLRLDSWLSFEKQIYFAGYLSVLSPTTGAPVSFTLEKLTEKIGTTGAAFGLKVLVLKGRIAYAMGTYSGAGIEVARGWGAELTYMTQDQTYNDDLSISICSGCNSLYYGGISFGSIVNLKWSGVGQALQSKAFGKSIRFSPLGFHVLKWNDIKIALSHYLATVSHPNVNFKQK